MTKGRLIRVDSWGLARRTPSRVCGHRALSGRNLVLGGAAGTLCALSLFVGVRMRYLDQSTVLEVDGHALYGPAYLPGTAERLHTAFYSALFCTFSTQYHSPRQLTALGAAPRPYLGMKVIAPAFMQ